MLWYVLENVMNAARITPLSIWRLRTMALTKAFILSKFGAPMLPDASTMKITSAGLAEQPDKHTNKQNYSLRSKFSSSSLSQPNDCLKMQHFKQLDC